MKLKCEICSEIIGSVIPEVLALPLTSAMFGSPDAPHGVPPPFNPELTWETFRCPFGPHNPMILPNRILTDLGYVEITPTGPVALDDGLDDAARTLKDRAAAEAASERVAREQLGLIPKAEETAPVAEGPVAFACTLCGKTFREKRFLGSHMHMKHPEATNAIHDQKS